MPSSIIDDAEENSEQPLQSVPTEPSMLHPVTGKSGPGCMRGTSLHGLLRACICSAAAFRDVQDGDPACMLRN